MKVLGVPGLKVYLDSDPNLVLRAEGTLSPLMAPVLSRINGRLKSEKPALVLDDRVIVSSWLPPIPSPAFSRLIKGELMRVIGNPIPSTLSMEVTPRCRCRCAHCTVAEGDEPSFEQLNRVIQDALELGSVILTFTEGDPILRDDIVELVASVDERAIINLFTPATDLTYEKAVELKEAGLQGVLISIYSTDPAKHDAVRRLQGAQKFAIEGIRAALDAGLIVTMSTHIGASTMHELEPLYRLAEDLGVHEFSVWESVQDAPTPQQRETILEMYDRVNSTPGGPRMFASTRFEGGDFGCLAATRWGHVGVDGGLRPCPYIPVSFGNVFDEGLKHIWKRMSREFKVEEPVCPMQSEEFRKSLQ